MIVLVPKTCWFCLLRQGAADCCVQSPSWAVLRLGGSWFEEVLVPSWSGDARIRLVLVIKEVLLSACE